MTLPERSPAPEVVERWILECLRAGEGRAQLSVSGTCMEPSLKEGSRIDLRLPDGPVRLGDVVLLRTPAGLRLHRVLLRFRDTIRTKGDRGVYLDPAAKAGAVIAICGTNESRWTKALKIALSIARLLARARTGSSGGSDAAHAGLLP